MSYGKRFVFLRVWASLHEKLQLSTWSTEEIASVLHFLNQVEAAYEKKVAVSDLLDSYATFKTIVKSKAQEKQIDREFQQSSSYSTYQAVKAAKAKEKGYISLGK